MKFLLFALVTLLLVALLATGFFHIYDYKFQPTVKNGGEVIEIYDRENLKIINPECEEARTQLSLLINAPQTCQSVDDCESEFHGCDVLALNTNSHASYQQWLGQERKQCLDRIITSCPEIQPYSIGCIKNTCQVLHKLDTKKEIRKLLNQRQ